MKVKITLQITDLFLHVSCSIIAVSSFSIQFIHFNYRYSAMSLIFFDFKTVCF